MPLRSYRPRCSNDDCFNITEKGAFYCLKHLCTYENCFGEVSDSEEKYCYKHYKCAEENCDAIIDGIHSLYCENHRRCAFDTCDTVVGKENFYCSHPDHFYFSFAQPIRDDHFDDCLYAFAQPIPEDYFTCLTSNCLKIQENDSLFCEEHNSCNVIHCSEKPETWSYYCINHRDYSKNNSSEGKCIEENCNEKSETCVNLIYNPIYCLSHRRCYHHDCFDKVSADSYFCDSHFPGNQEAHPEFNSVTLDSEESNSSIITHTSSISTPNSEKSFNESIKRKHKDEKKSIKKMLSF